MFAIGDDNWPGLSKLTEECGELLQVIGKLMATHGEPKHWDGTDLMQRFLDEMGDLGGAHEFVVGFMSRDDRASVRQRAREKLALFQRWHSDGFFGRRTQNTTPSPVLSTDASVTVDTANPTAAVTFYDDELPHLSKGQVETREILGHLIVISHSPMPSAFHTGRARYHVVCATCRIVLHDATTSARAQIDSHARKQVEQMSDSDAFLLRYLRICAVRTVSIANEAFGKEMSCESLGDTLTRIEHGIAELRKTGDGARERVSELGSCNDQMRDSVTVIAEDAFGPIPVGPIGSLDATLSHLKRGICALQQRISKLVAEAEVADRASQSVHRRVPREQAIEIALEAANRHKNDPDSRRFPPEWVIDAVMSAWKAV